MIRGRCPRSEEVVAMPHPARSRRSRLPAAALCAALVLPSVSARAQDYDKDLCARLDPADVFQMALECTGGDLALGALAAHNLLKEATYAERGQTAMMLGALPGTLEPPALQKLKDALGSDRVSAGAAKEGTRVRLP